jgi:hypothetical protein
VSGAISSSCRTAQNCSQYQSATISRAAWHPHGSARRHSNSESQDHVSIQHPANLRACLAARCAARRESQLHEQLRRDPFLTHVRFAAAISAIKCCTLAGTCGRPCGLDFHRQNKRNPFRCNGSASPASQRSAVSANRSAGPRGYFPFSVAFQMLPRASCTLKNNAFAASAIRAGAFAVEIIDRRAPCRCSTDVMGPAGCLVARSSLRNHRQRLPSRSNTK